MVDRFTRILGMNSMVSVFRNSGIFFLENVSDPKSFCALPFGHDSTLISQFESC